MSKISQDDAFLWLNAVVYSTQFEACLDDPLDRIFERFVLSEVNSGRHATSWFAALFQWCIDNAGWRETLLPSKFDEAAIRAFLANLAQRLEVYRQEMGH